MANEPAHDASVGPDTTAGRRIGRFEVIRKLARGGMAELLLARVRGTQGFQKLVVIKRILPGFGDEPDFIRMFLREARLAATLNHPNVVQVFDIGREGTDYFFTMEYVHGVDLRQVLAGARNSGQRLPFEHAVWIGLGLAAGLHHAHERIGTDGKALGIVHRDVSPSNVLVAYDGSVKVVDFGIAKAETRRKQTVGSSRKGKLPYMSPEQCRAQPLDRRSDVFSIGCVLYELVTMTRLFGGDSEYDIMQRIVDADAPRPRLRCSEVPLELERIVLRCLQRDPAARYQSAKDLQLDLEQFARTAQMACSAGSMAAYLETILDPPPDPYGELGPRITAAPGPTAVTVAPTKAAAVDGDAATIARVDGAAVIVPTAGGSTVARAGRPGWPWFAVVVGLAVLTGAVGATIGSRSTTPEPAAAGSTAPSDAPDPPSSPPPVAAPPTTPRPSKPEPAPATAPAPAPTSATPAQPPPPTTVEPSPKPTPPTPTAKPRRSKPKAKPKRPRPQTGDDAKPNEELFPF